MLVRWDSEPHTVTQESVGLGEQSRIIDHM